MKTNRMEKSEAGAIRALKSGVYMDMTGQIYVSFLSKSLEEDKVT